MTAYDDSCDRERMRPMLKPALRRLWRDPVTVQLGTGGSDAVVLAGRDLDDLAVLDLLDGGRTTAGLLTEAERLGHSRESVQRLLDTLADAGALDDATGLGAVPARLQPDLMSLSLLHRPPGAGRRALAARADATVTVHGGGRVGATVASLLAAAGVGALDTVDAGTLRDGDLAPGGCREVPRSGASRGEIARRSAEVNRAAASVGRAPDGAVRVAVLCPVDPLLPPEWLVAVREVPHLPVLVRETTAILGPLVEPGATPCLRCLELARGDRDPAWPALTAQLVGGARQVEACDVTLASLAASLAAMQVLTYLDGATPPPTRAATLEFGLRDMRLRRRTLAAHPGCGCGADTLPG
jgi:bacteriocin biosynthesis cyclodehydratase domain-containing protein